MPVSASSRKARQDDDYNEYSESEEGSVLEASEEAPGPTVSKIYDEIEALLEKGIGKGEVKKLKEGGIHTVQAIVMHTKKELAAVKGLSDAKVEKIIAAANEILDGRCGSSLMTGKQFLDHRAKVINITTGCLSDAKVEKIIAAANEILDGRCGSSLMTGKQFLDHRAKVINITTGCTAVDAVLGGGIETMSITELFGEARVGKSQLCHTLAVSSQLPLKKHGAAGKVVYIDTEGTFRPERLKPIAERFGLKYMDVLENIICARAYTHEQQMEILYAVAAKMAEERFALVIVDSVTALFRVDFQGRGELADRQQKLGKYMSKLLKIAELYNVAVVITNQVTADPGGGAMFMVDPKKPIGGNIIAHASTVRVSLKKGRGTNRKFVIFDSPSLAESEAVFDITTGGVSDASGAYIKKGSTILFIEHQPLFSDVILSLKFEPGEIIIVTTKLSKSAAKVSLRRQLNTHFDDEEKVSRAMSIIHIIEITIDESEEDEELYLLEDAAPHELGVDRSTSNIGIGNYASESSDHKELVFQQEKEEEEPDEFAQVSLPSSTVKKNQGELTTQTDTDGQHTGISTCTVNTGIGTPVTEMRSTTSVIQSRYIYPKSVWSRISRRVRYRETTKTSSGKSHDPKNALVDAVFLFSIQESFRFVVHDSDHAMSFFLDFIRHTVSLDGICAGICMNVSLLGLFSQDRVEGLVKRGKIVHKLAEKDTDIKDGAEIKVDSVDNPDADVLPLAGDGSVALGNGTKAALSKPSEGIQVPKGKQGNEEKSKKEEEEEERVEKKEGRDGIIEDEQDVEGSDKTDDDEDIEERLQRGANWRDIIGIRLYFHKLFVFTKIPDAFCAGCVCEEGRRIKDIMEEIGSLHLTYGRRSSFSDDKHSSSALIQNHRDILASFIGKRRQSPASTPYSSSLDLTSLPPSLRSRIKDIMEEIGSLHLTYGRRSSFSDDKHSSSALIQNHRDILASFIGKRRQSPASTPYSSSLDLTSLPPSLRSFARTHVAVTNPCPCSCIFGYPRLTGKVNKTMAESFPVRYPILHVDCFKRLALDCEWWEQERKRLVKETVHNNKGFKPSILSETSTAIASDSAASSEITDKIDAPSASSMCSTLPLSVSKTHCQGKNINMASSCVSVEVYSDMLESFLYEAPEWWKYIKGTPFEKEWLSVRASVDPFLRGSLRTAHQLYHDIAASVQVMVFRKKKSSVLKK
ncbi:Dmc1b [Aduncisulcus paluster]|uniref:Dmc1b n=1 Tax=Aduncisulcus paluster TaxID=2918883 RepID=A0ABQ5KUG5_9EUKA|nr:Dmc1b [Aduncisulcus paluster]